MKKIIVILVAGLVASVATADLTGFDWQGGAAGTATAGQYAYSYLGAETLMTAFVSGGEIDITDFQSLTSIGAGLVDVASAGPPFFGIWLATGAEGDGTWVGQNVFAVVGNATTAGGVGVGDTINIFGAAGPLIDLKPTANPALPNQIFLPGAVTTVTVIPEPATVGLFGLGALSAWIIRRKGRS